MDCVNLEDAGPHADRDVLHLLAGQARRHQPSRADVQFEKAKAELGERALIELEPDVHNPLLLNTAAGPVLDAVDYKQLIWPGHGVRDDQPYQYLDREYMKADEYDEFIEDPTGYYLRKYLPRVCGVFEGFEEFPDLPGLHYFRLVGGVRGFGRPKLRAALERVLKACDEVDRFAEQHRAFTERMTALGFPTSHISTSVAPYDLVADYFRGATGTMKDLYRKKDKLLQLLDKACTFLTRQTINWSTRLPASDRVLPDPLGARQLHVAGAVQDLLVADVPPTDAQSDRRRHHPDAAVGSRLLEAAGSDPRHPAGQMHLLVRAHRHGEGLRGARRRGGAARQYLAVAAHHRPAGGGRRGGASHLVDNVFNKGGKLILDAAFGIPDETPVANARAMYAAARKYAS